MDWSYAAILTYLVVAWADGRRGLAEAGRAALRALPLVLMFAVLFVLPGFALRLSQMDQIRQVSVMTFALQQIGWSLALSVLLTAGFGLIAFVLPASLDRRIGPLPALVEGLALARRHGRWLIGVLAALWAVELLFEFGLAGLTFLKAPEALAELERNMLIMDWIRFGVGVVSTTVMGLFWPSVYLLLRPARVEDAAA